MDFFQRARIRLFILALPATLPLYGFAQGAATVRIGNETKQTTAVVKQLQNGDIACVMILQDAQGKEFVEQGDFDICFQKPSLIGKRVSLKYKMANVMAASCQGDPDCKKSDRIALVSEARILGASEAPGTGARMAQGPMPAAGQKSFCAPSEEIVFACRTGAKLVSVCAARDATINRGYVQYRFGKPDSREPLEMMLPADQPPIAKSASGESVPFAGGGGAWMRFRQAPFAYVVYSGIGRWGPKGETMEKQGVVVERGGKRIAHLKCTEQPDGMMGPDWFEKVGLRSNGEEFDFPD